MPVTIAEPITRDLLPNDAQEAVAAPPAADEAVPIEDSLSLSVEAEPVAATPKIETIAVPDTCPGCHIAWEQNQCPRCALSRGEVAALLQTALTAAGAARRAADDGRYDEARRYITRAAELGLGESESLRKLDTFCALVTGDWSGVGIDDVPPEWRAAVAQGSSLLAAYESARAAAGTADTPADWEAVLTSCQCLVEVAPWLLPAQKLRLLCLYGMGNGAEAERLRRSLLEQIPGEPDLCRWRFAPSTVVAADTVEESAAESTGSQTDRETAGESKHRDLQPSSPLRQRMLNMATAALAVMAIVATIYFKPWSGAKDTKTYRESVPTSKAAGGDIASSNRPRTSTKLPVADALPVSLRRIRAENLRAADAAQARQWFNQAVGARRKKRYLAAYHFADGAYRLQPKGYLAEEALLLRAQSADNLHYRRAAYLYGLIPARFPRSEYAPLGLQLAAQAAEHQGRYDEATGYIRQLKQRYPESKEAARAGRLLKSTFPVR